MEDTINDMALMLVDVICLAMNMYLKKQYGVLVVPTLCQFTELRSLSAVFTVSLVVQTFLGRCI